MSEWFDPTGRTTFGIGICDRCKEKMSIQDLHPDPNAPGLRVCVECRDVFDPYRLPARQTENIALQFTRPDEPLDFDADAITEFMALATQSPLVLIYTENGEYMILELNGDPI